MLLHTSELTVCLQVSHSSQYPVFLPCLCYPDLLEVSVKQGSLITGVQWLQCETWIDLLC